MRGKDGKTATAWSLRAAQEILQVCQGGDGKGGGFLPASYKHRAHDAVCAGTQIFRAQGGARPPRVTAVPSAGPPYPPTHPPHPTPPSAPHPTPLPPLPGVV